MEKVGQIYKDKQTNGLFKITIIKEKEGVFSYNFKAEGDKCYFQGKNVFTLNYFQKHKDFYELVKDVKGNFIPIIYVSRLSRVE